MRNVALVCYWVAMHFPKTAACSVQQREKRQPLQLFQGVQLTLRGKQLLCYVLFSWLLLWLAFLEVNHGENCSPSCLENTKGRSGGPSASSLRVGFTRLLTGPSVPRLTGELGL